MSIRTGSATGRAGRSVKAALLVGTMMSGGLALSVSTPAMAQQAAQSISVPAGSLTDGLNSLAAQANLQIIFDAELASGKTTAGVSGNLTPAQALSSLLAGTGIAAQFAGSNNVVLSLTTASTEGEIAGATLLEALTIYGARDATTLDDTSASVAVVTSEAIETAQIRSVRDSFRRMANVMDADWVNGGFIIRGVNSEGFDSSGALVGSIYVDGVVQTPDGARRGASGLWDVEQVEVYRGPQSTLSGRAALAGAIYVKTKDPTFDKEVIVSGTVGTDDLVGTAFVINAPIVENQIAMRISGAFERSKSDINYPTLTGFDRYDDLTTDLYYNIRGKLLFEPTEMPDTRAVLHYSFSHDAPLDRDVGGPGIGWDWNENRGDINSPDYTEPRWTRVHNAGLEVTHDFSDTLRLTSLTGLTHSHTDRSSVNAGTPGETFFLVGDRDDFLASQEVRLNYDGDRWSWVGGVYGSYDTYDNYTDRTSSHPRNVFSRTRQNTTNVAAFGEATYEFVPTWKLTAGGRIDYTTQKVRDFSDRAQPPGTPRVIVSDFTAQHEETNFLPKIGLSKDLTEDHTIGVVYSQGFRTGGGKFDRQINEPYSYAPEKSSNYEAFYKGSFLDGLLTLNANVFYTDFSDQQVEIVTDPTNYYTRTFNAASSRSYGFEIEPSIQVNDNFRAFASLGYLNTRFDQFSTPYLGDLAGMPFPEAPEWSFAVGGTYIFDNGVYIGGDLKYVSSSMARLSFTPPLDFLEPRTIVNLQAGYRTDSWEINVYAENLLDERYFTYYDNDAYGTIGEGRRIGLNVKAKF